MKVLGLICMAAGFLLAILAGVVWWPGLDEYSWPGVVPVLVIGAGAGLIWLGVYLWTGRYPPPLD
jgi:hypothetical protein